MASTDARPVPIKNTAYRLTFPIYKNDGTLITGATGLDSEVSKDAGTFTDCTNEATEIATSSGVYYLDLSSTEMNADCVAVVVKTTSTDAVPPSFILYPQETGDIKTDVQSWLGTACATPTVNGVPEVDVTHWIGTAAATPTTAGVPEVDVTYWVGTAVGSAHVTANVTQWNGSNVSAPSVSGVPKIDISHVNGAAFNVSNAQFGASVVSVAANALTASALATDAVNEIVAAVLAGVVESGFTVQDVLKLCGAAAAGKSSGLDTGSPIYRNLGDTLNRISATASAGNRTAVTHNLG